MVILENGDMKVSSHGEVLECTGREALIQEVILRLRARRGAFLLDPELGSSLWKLDVATAREGDILAIVMEALLPMREIEVLELTRRLESANDRLELFLRLKIDGQEETLLLDGE